jgi:hypothetical protein
MRIGRPQRRNLALLRGTHFHSALDLDWNAASSASSAQNSLQKSAPVELRQHSTRPSTTRKGWPQ